MQMPKNHANVFSHILENIEKLDDLIDLQTSTTLTGIFKARQKKNKKGITNAKATFLFKDDFITGIGLDKIKFKDRTTSSIFGDNANARMSGRGNKKFDYFDDGKKIVELSVEPGYIKEFENGKKLHGFFRINLEDDFIALSTGQREQFQANKILTAAFEVPLI